MARKRKTVDDCIRACSAEVVPLMEDLRGLVHATLPGVTEDLQYGVPVFLNTHGVPVIYLFGAKKHVNFGFLRSAELADPNGILRGSGTPSKHIRIMSGKPIDEATLIAFVRQCGSLGHATGSPASPPKRNPV